MVEVPHLSAVEAHFPARAILAIELRRDRFTVQADDGGHVPIGDRQILHRRGELDPVAPGEVPSDLLIGTDSLQALGIVGHLAAVLTAHGDAIGFGIHGGHICVAATL